MHQSRRHVQPSSHRLPQSFDPAPPARTSRSCSRRPPSPSSSSDEHNAVRIPSLGLSSTAPLSAKDATLAMLTKWDMMDPLPDDAARRGRRSSSAPGSRARVRPKSRVREWELHDWERERFRKIQVEMERRIDAGEDVSDAEQESQEKEKEQEKAREQEQEEKERRKSEDFFHQMMRRTATPKLGKREAEQVRRARSRAGRSSVATSMHSGVSELSSEYDDKSDKRGRGSVKSLQHPQPRRPPSVAPSLAFSDTSSRSPSPPPSRPDSAHSRSSRRKPRPSSLAPSSSVPSRSLSLPPSSNASSSIPSPVRTPRSPKAASPRDSASASPEVGAAAAIGGGGVLEQLPDMMKGSLSRLIPGLFSGGSALADELVRVEVGKAADWKEGEMKEVPFPNAKEKILVSKVAESFHATSSRCTFSNSGLAEGILTHDGVVRLAHGASYNVQTGEVHDGGGTSSLHIFKLEHDQSSGSLFVSARPIHVDATSGPSPKRVNISRSDASPGVVIIGGGAGAFYASDALRTGGYQGKITILSKEGCLPYDRTKLSKQWVKEGDELSLRQSSYYDRFSIKVRLSTEAIGLDIEKRKVDLADGTSVSYDKVVVATGCTSKHLRIPGSDLEGVLTLRNLEDARELFKIMRPESRKRPRSVVVIGASFLGTEVALLFSKTSKVALVERNAVPLEPLLGTRLGKALQASHEELGSVFRLTSSPVRFIESEGQPGQVASVELDDGTKLVADVVVLAVGARPATGLLKKSGVKLEVDGRVQVDSKGRVRGTGSKRVFAVGDIVAFKDKTTGSVINTEHWNAAANQARLVARSIIGKPSLSKPLLALPPSCPIVWSKQPSSILHWVGSNKASEWETVIIVGDLTTLACTGYFAQGDNIVAVVNLSPDGANPLIAHCAELIREGRMLTLQQVRDRVNPLSVRLRGQ